MPIKNHKKRSQLKSSERLRRMIKYTPESKIRHPMRMFREMWQDLVNSRGLAWRLIIRDISAQYRQTALGYFWAIFPPIITSGVFILLNASKVIQIEGLEVHYTVYVFMGTIFWQVFVDAMNAPLKVVTESRQILARINLPKEALILSGIGRVLFSLGIKMILLLFVFIFFTVSVKWTVIFIPLPLLGLLLLGTMAGVLLLPVGLLYKDIQSALLIATSGLVFVTPVAYPSTTGGILGKIMRINPLTPLLSSARDLVLRGIPNDLASFFSVFFLAAVTLFIGWIIYRLALPIVIERISA